MSILILHKRLNFLAKSMIAGIRYLRTPFNCYYGIVFNNNKMCKIHFHRISKFQVDVFIRSGNLKVLFENQCVGKIDNRIKFAKKIDFACSNRFRLRQGSNV